MRVVASAPQQRHEPSRSWPMFHPCRQPAAGLAKERGPSFAAGTSTHLSIDALTLSAPAVVVVAMMSAIPLLRPVVHAAIETAVRVVGTLVSRLRATCDDGQQEQS